MKKYFLLMLVSLLITSFQEVSVYAASCGATKPEKAPDLFQIDVTRTTAKLYFTPLQENITQYTILYGLAKGRDDYFVAYPHGPDSGVLNFTINALSPNTTYYFRVRPENGCRIGYKSDTLSATTDSNFKVVTRMKGESQGSTKAIQQDTLVLNFPTPTTFLSPTPEATMYKPKIVEAANPTPQPKKASFLSFIQLLFSSLFK